MTPRPRGASCPSVAPQARFGPKAREAKGVVLVGRPKQHAPGDPSPARQPAGASRRMLRFARGSCRVRCQREDMPPLAEPLFQVLCLFSQSCVPRILRAKQGASQPCRFCLSFCDAKKETPVRIWAFRTAWSTSYKRMIPQSQNDVASLAIGTGAVSGCASS